MTVRFRLLGAVEAAVDGRPIPIGHPKLRCMLAVLLVEANQPVTADQFVDRVWAEGRLPHQPRRAVQHNIALLRRALAEVPGVTLTRSGAGYRLSADTDTIDLHLFHALLARARDAQAGPVAREDTNRQDTALAEERAAVLYEQALALWRGEPFADVDVGTAWLHTQRATLTAHHHAARLDLNDIRLRQGRHTALLAELAAQIAQYPLDERLAGQYLLALYRSGRQAEALAHYDRLRHLLAEELGTDPSPPLRRLHHQILTAAPELATPTATPVAAPPVPVVPRPVPRQLPAPPHLFTGRATELAALNKALDIPADALTEPGGTVLISAIGGVGGIGKTWLALHWAHRHLDRFPDGQLYVNLRGFDPSGEPVSPATAVRGFLDTLGVAPAAIPAELDTQVGLYRSLLAGKRMLIVLDNARSAAQVTAVLPGSPTCTVLITSRHHLGGLVTAHGARVLTLDVLPEPEAHRLLTRHLGHDRVAAEPAAVADLLAGCAGLPLALGIVAARATRHPHFPLAALAGELRDQSRRLDALDPGDAHTTLRAVLSWSVRALSESAAAAFGLLGLAPGPDVGLPAAASLLAQPEPVAHALLRELTDASLLQEHTPGRYRMHDLVRLYATDTAHRDIADDAREAALRRVLDCYTHTAHAAHLLLDPHRQPGQLDQPMPGVCPQPLPDVPAALAWLVAEHPNLLAAQYTAAQHAWHRTVWQLAWSLDTFHYRRGHRHDRLAVWRAALDAATHLSDPTIRILTHRSLGRAYGALDRQEEGIQHLHQALALARDHHDTDQQAHTERALAMAWTHRGDNRRAMRHATEARNLFCALDQPVWEAEALNGVGWYAAKLGEYTTAREHCRAALTLYRHHHYPAGEADTLDSLGYIAHHTGEHRQAVDYYQQSLTLYHALGNTSEAADTLDRLGHPHVALGEYQRAGAVWQEALRLFREQGRDTDAARVRHQLDSLDVQAGSHLPARRRVR